MLISPFEGIRNLLIFLDVFGIVLPFFFEAFKLISHDLESWVAFKYVAAAVHARVALFGESLFQVRPKPGLDLCVFRIIRQVIQAAVVGGYDYNGIVEFADVLEFFYHAGQMHIELVDLKAIVEHVATYFFGIGQKWRNLDVLKFFSFCKTQTWLIAAVRFAAAVPEAERGRLRKVGEEVFEVAGVIVTVYF